MSEPRRKAQRGMKGFARVSKRSAAGATKRSKRSSNNKPGASLTADQMEILSYLGPITRKRAKRIRQEEVECSYQVIEEEEARSGAGSGDSPRAGYPPPSPRSCESSGTTDYPASQPSTNPEAQSAYQAAQEDAQGEVRTRGLFLRTAAPRRGARRASAAVAAQLGGGSAAEVSESIKTFLDKMEAHQRTKQEEAKEKYNFDFENCRRLRGAIKWTKVRN